MKKLSILFLSTVAFVSTLTSCSDDNNATAPTTSAINGKWTFDTYTETNDGKTGEVKDATPAGCTNKDSFDFKASDATFKIEILDSECVAIKLAGSWTLQNGVISTIDTDNNVNKYTVVSVSASKLVLKKFKVEGVNDTYSTHYLSK